MTDSIHNGVYRATVQLGDFEMEIECSDVVWDDIELPPMSLELFGANYDEQIRAVRQFLSWQDRAEASMREDLKRAEQVVKAASGEVRDWLNEDLIERWHSSVYEDAMRSTAAVVMLTPLVESMFHRLALALGVPWQGRRIPRQIMKLVRYCGFAESPNDFEQTLKALFTYRNTMFHWGIEWPIEKRGQFEELIKLSGWPTSWFDQAIQGDGPWVFYLTEEFVYRCVELVEQMIDEVRSYIHTKGLDVGREQSNPLLRQVRPLSLTPLRAALAEASRASPNLAGVGQTESS